MRPLVFAVALAIPTTVMAAPITPDFASALFGEGAPVNPYFPLVEGQHNLLVAFGEEDGETFTETTDLTNIGAGPVILGVQTFVQQDLTYEGELLVEKTLDYYATDLVGNVWYFGEDVVNYIYDDNGLLIDTTNESAWLAGVDGALPGWIMPAEPEVGLSYFQEIAELAGALDEAQIFALGQTVEIAGVGVFDDVLVTFETTSLDPDAREFKYYAPGVGLIRIEEGLSENLDDPELVFNLVPEVPLPGGLPLLLGALGLGALLRRR